MADGAGRGAQVRLDGDQQRLARGALAPTLGGNLEGKRLLEAGGTVSDGFTPDGSSPLGVPAADEVLAPDGAAPADALVPPFEVAALAARVTDLEGRIAAMRAQMDGLERRYG